MKGKRLLILTVLWSMAWLGPVHAARQNDIKAIPECKYCGMYREHYAHSRVVVQHEKGSAVGTCSINCAALEEIRNLDDPPHLILVGDYRTKKLVDGQRATWVLGGDVSGVMTQRAKWAFAKRRDAVAFIKKHGGRLATFDDIMKATYEDMYEDMKPLKVDMDSTE